MAKLISLRAIAAAIAIPSAFAWACSAPTPQEREVTEIGSESGASATPSDDDAASAQEVMAVISSKIPAAKLVKVYTEDDDPNKMLGRPNGYSSKVAFSDSRIAKSDITGTRPDAIERGGSIEVFADMEGAAARAKYIQTMLKNTGFGTEYDYISGGVLVRVTGNLTSTEAKEYKSALG